VTLAAIAGLLFLHLPLAFIFLYAFTTEEKSYQFPPPGYTLRWFAVAWERQDIWNALWLSVQVAAVDDDPLEVGVIGGVHRLRFFHSGLRGAPPAPGFAQAVRSV